MGVKSKANETGGENSGRLKIGDHWNAISIIALSQTNPLKAIAEFVENSINAWASEPPCGRIADAVTIVPFRISNIPIIIGAWTKKINIRSIWT